MAALQPVRGTHDLLPAEMRAHLDLVAHARDAVELYGFEPVATPIFEFTEVFQRTLGETSDVVTKEMYTFEDKGGESLTLRPENTAGVARCFLSQGLAQQTPVKLFYAGPMFRRERPQKGRLRQFHQIGVELIGAAQPLADVETIAAAVRVLKALGVAEDTVLELKSLGAMESRAGYRDVLVDYLKGHLDSLSEDSRARLERNPLRVLDTKDEGDKAVVAGAPVLADHLNEESRDFFKAVCDGLDALGIGYRRNDTLVRGLDYYCHTTFEFTTEALGAQGTVLAGGRYDGLMQMMGGPPTPGVGWAAGIERLAMLRDFAIESRRPVALVPLGAAAEARCLALSESLRSAGLRVDLGYSGNLSRRMKRANKANAAATVILGEDELARGVATVRDMETGEQEDVPLDGLAERLSRYA